MGMCILPRLVLCALGTLIPAVSGCADSNTVGPVEESGSITVTVQTSATTADAALDPDGYAVFVSDMGVQPIGSSGELTLTDVSPGEHVVRLEEMQVNCTTPGSNPALVTVVAGGTAGVAFQVTCWPPSTGRIAFTRDDDIYSMNADGSDLVQLTTQGGAFWPAWSPDGWRIAFTFGDGVGGVRTLVMPASGIGDVRLTSSPNPEEAPSWSPDGTRIAFGRYSSPSWDPEDIWVVDADGGRNEVALTSDPARDFLPSWSPDGSKIVFTTDRDGNEEVYVMNADGSDPVNLTNDPGSDVAWAGAWSPDGMRIAFNSNRTGNSEVYVMNADGSGLVNLTNSPFNERGPAWSPDGTKLVFSQHPVGNIFVINADGTGMVDITGCGECLDRYPHWSWGTGVIGAAPSGGR